MKTRTLRPTEIARSILRAEGISSLWTNKYENCRTVKGYLFEAKTSGSVARIQESIDNDPALKGCTVTVTEGGSSLYRADAIIIRVPNSLV